MNLSTIIFAAVTILLIIFVILIIYRLYKKGKKSYEEAFDKSMGGWDGAARAAINMLGEIPPEERRADENFAIAAGLQNNYLEGNIGRIRDEPGVGAAIVNGYNRALNNVRRGELGNIAANFIIRNAENFARAVIAPRIHPPPYPFIEIMYDIRNFDLDNIDNAENINNHIFPDIEIIDLLNNVNVTQRRNIAERKDDAQKAAGGVPAAAVGIFLDKSKTHTSDMQNVHDSAVSKAMKDTYDKIKDNAARNTPAAIKAEIREFMDKNNNNNNIKAAGCLEKIYNNPSLNFTLGGTDMDVLAAVWERSKDEENANNKTNIQESIVSALADMNPNNGSQSDSMVCVTGRTGRLLESLTLLDHDKSMSAAATVEMYRNEIFDNAKKIIDSKIEAEKSDVGDYYRGKITNEPMGSAEFKDTVIAELNKMVDTYGEKVPAADLNKLKEECAAAI